MTFNLCIDQKSIVEWQKENNISGIDIRHYHVLFDMMRFILKGRPQTHNCNSGMFFYYSNSLLSSALPLVFPADNKNARRMLRKNVWEPLSSSGLIEKKLVSGNRTYWRITYKAKGLFSEEDWSKYMKKCGKLHEYVADEKRPGVDEKRPGGGRKTSGYKAYILKADKEKVKKESLVLSGEAEAQQTQIDTKPVLFFDATESISNQYGHMLSTVKLEKLAEWVNFRNSQPGTKLVPASVDKIVMLWRGQTDEDVLSAVDTAISRNYRNVHFDSKKPNITKINEATELSTIEPKLHRYYSAYYKTCIELGCKYMADAEMFNDLWSGKIIYGAHYNYVDFEIYNILKDATLEYNAHAYHQKKMTLRDFVKEWPKKKRA